MLFRVRCSCGRIISYDIDLFFEEKQTIIDNKKMSKDEREAATSALMTKYKYKEQCCRAIMLGITPIHTIVQS
jgi:DNA-directed RNA polymerase subunit N (RpoN/RPB10)